MLVEKIDLKFLLLKRLRIATLPLKELMLNVPVVYKSVVPLIMVRLQLKVERRPSSIHSCTRLAPNAEARSISDN